MPGSRVQTQARAHGVLQVAGLREAAGVPLREDQLPVDAHVEDAAPPGHKRDAGQVGLVRGQQLLGEPGRPAAEVAHLAVLDGDGRPLAHAFILCGNRARVNVVA